MIKYRKDCKVCQAIKEDKKLVEVLYDSRHYLKTSGKSLREIHEAYKNKFSYVSLTNHCRKHQFISEAAYTKRHMNQAAKKAEQKMIHRAIESAQVFDEIIGQGMEKLQTGKLEMTTRDLLSAAKYKKDFQLKEQDQQLAMMEMVFHFTSGENNRKDSDAYDRRIIEGEAVTDYDPTLQPAADFDRRAAQSRAFYQSLAGNAAPPGAD